MFFRNNTFQRLILCLLFFTPLKFINATQLTNSNLIEFSLAIQNLTTDFKFPTNTYEVEVDLLGISWYESFSKHFHAGLEIGYIDMSQINNPLVSAQFSSGQFAGVLFRVIPIDQTYISLNLNLNYRYTKTEANSLNQITQFTNSRQYGYQFSVNFKPYTSADIGIKWFTGNKRGGGLYFSRRF